MRTIRPATLDDLDLLVRVDLEDEGVTPGYRADWTEADLARLRRKIQAFVVDADKGALVAEEAFDSLRAKIVRVTAPDMQIPFSPSLEKQMYPTKDTIAAAVRQVLDLAPALQPAAS